jgi:LIVCS family branched-chain amino acid:cation transporter
MQLTVGLVAALSLVEVLAGQFNWTAVSKIISALPLAGRSLTWLLPALVGIVLSLFLPNKQESEVFEM